MSEEERLIDPLGWLIELLEQELTRLLEKTA